MKEEIKEVQVYYNENVLTEWNRLETHPFEFKLTTSMMEKYIKPKDHVLDIGGGPGRYSLYFAQKGCNVTLVDLSTENILFTSQKAEEQNLKITALECNACEVDKFVFGTFDHVFIMGPMYHLLDETDRINAINSALSMLKVGGKIYVSFILIFAGMIYGMKYMPEMVLNESEEEFIDCVLKDTSFAGDAFTKSYFSSLSEIIPFMSQFPLKKLHLFGQEGILSPCESNLLGQPAEVIEKWIEIAVHLCEREELLGYTEHMMYVGEKTELNPKK